jgi:alpha/beta superfamily hydrolase
MSSKIFLHNQEMQNYPIGKKIKISINTDHGKLEGIYGVGSKDPSAPTLLLFHPQPNSNGTMYNEVLQNVLSFAMSMGFVVLTINFSGVGNSSGRSDNGHNEFQDAIAAFKWLCSQRPYSKSRWVFGFSFGAYIAAQLTMRRPEIDHFIFLSMPIEIYDVSFFSPCPVNGLFIHAEQDKIIPESSLVDFFIKNDKCRNISYSRINSSTNHFFKNVDFKKTLFPHIYKYIKTHCTWQNLILQDEYEQTLDKISFLQYNDFVELLPNLSNNNLEQNSQINNIYQKPKQQYQSELENELEEAF